MTPNTDRSWVWGSRTSPGGNQASVTRKASTSRVMKWGLLRVTGTKRGAMPPKPPRHPARLLGFFQFPCLLQDIYRSIHESRARGAPHGGELDSTNGLDKEKRCV